MAYAAEDSDDDRPKGKRHSLVDLFEAKNIVELLDEVELAEIARKVTEEYEIDEASREPWLKKIGKAMDLAMLVSTTKTYPYDGASNVKFPLMATAALQFNARSYPAIVPGDRVVKCKTWGDDEDGSKAARADRVSEHMTWQLTAEMPEWEEDTDRLTVILPIAGCAFRKIFYDPTVGRNVSRLITAKNLVVNYWARSMEDVPRITEKMYLYPYEVQERINSGRFVAFDYDNLSEAAGDDDGKEGQPTTGDEDPDGPMLFLEQHRLLDLDGDGTRESYIVTVHKGSAKVCRIIANYTLVDETAPDNGQQPAKIKITASRRLQYFVKYQFLPAPDGGFYGLGFGWLLNDTNESINTTLNQMFDAGHLSNMQGGLISSVLGMREKSIVLKRGEYKVINTSLPLNQAIYQVKYDGPSPVLFQLLGLLIESGEKLASIKDVLTGDTAATAPVGTTLAMIEQGLQVFTSIYKRIHRTLKAEFKLIGQLNKTNLTPERYNEFHDGAEPFDPAADYGDADMDILPVSDPQSVTKMQKVAKAQAVFEISKENPSVDQREATKRMFDAIEVEDIEKLMPEAPPPDPEAVEMAKRAAEAEVATMEAEAEERIASATGKLAAAIKAIADAEGVEVGNQMGYYAQIVDMLKAEHGMEMDISGQEQAQQQAMMEQGMGNAGPGGIPGMEGQPGNPMGNGSPPGLGGAGGGELAGAPAPAIDPAIAGGMEPNAGPGGLPQGSL